MKVYQILGIIIYLNKKVMQESMDYMIPPVYSINEEDKFTKWL